MEWLLIVLAAGGGGTYGALRFRSARADRRQRAEELEGIRRLADEDVTVFGEQLQRLGESLGDHPLDGAAQVDYQVALDAYERGKWDAPRLAVADEISSLVDTLASGRYALACVQARVAGEPVPERRVPCFFNPQHGPSARPMMWTSSRTGTRTVPACTRCAAQLEAREKPEVRTVQIGSRRVPYWEAGATFSPYGRGYFPEGSAMSGAVAWMFLPPDVGMATGGGFFDAPPSGGMGGMEFGGYESGGDGGAYS